MQTFLPYPSFVQSAQVLDTRRLVKQRVETFQILRAITDPTYGWQHHPAVNMWRRHTASLALYGAAIDAECARRGVADHKNLAARIAEYEDGDWRTADPEWLGDPRLHHSHRSNLIRKDPEHYGPFWPHEDDDLPYFWPTKEFPYA